MHLTKEGPYSVFEMLFYPLVLGSLGILWIDFVGLRLIGVSLRDLNFRSNTVLLDLLFGLLLSPILVLIFYLEQLTIYRWLPRVNQDALQLIQGLMENPLLLALWLGPTVWIGIAAFEEVSRCFLLRRLWTVWETSFAKWVTISSVSLLFGLVHLYQGPAGIAGVTVLSLFKSVFYLYYGRIWPLIIAHALYDSVQIAWVLILISTTGAN
jgi:membrane protease YdiL (CAAX protease family)